MTDGARTEARRAAVAVGALWLVALSAAGILLGVAAQGIAQETGQETAQETLDQLQAPAAEAETADPLARAIEQAAASVQGVAVRIGALDKLTGETGEVEIAVGATGAYGRMRIDVKACFARDVGETPEASAFLQIFDGRDDPPEQSFSGWMFASSPALSAMDHPRYDFWVLSCSTS